MYCWWVLSKATIIGHVRDLINSLNATYKLWIIIQIYYISRIIMPKLKSLFLCLNCLPLSLKSSLHRAIRLDMWSRIGILSFPSIPYRMRRKKPFWRSWGRSVHADVVPMWTLMYERYKTEILMIVWSFDLVYNLSHKSIKPCDPFTYHKTVFMMINSYFFASK